MAVEQGSDDDNLSISEEELIALKDAVRGLPRKDTAEKLEEFYPDLKALGQKTTDIRRDLVGRDLVDRTEKGRYTTYHLNEDTVQILANHRENQLEQDNSLDREEEVLEKDRRVEMHRDDLFHILSASRRRDALRYLRDSEGDRVVIGDLASEIAALETDEDVRTVDSSARKSVYVNLYQDHLPKLEEEEIIINQNGELALGPAFEIVEGYLRDDFEITNRTELGGDQLPEIESTETSKGDDLNFDVFAAFQYDEGILSSLFSDIEDKDVENSDNSYEESEWKEAEKEIMEEWAENKELIDSLAERFGGLVTSKKEEPSDNSYSESGERRTTEKRLENLSWASRSSKDESKEQEINRSRTGSVETSSNHLSAGKDTSGQVKESLDQLYREIRARGEFYLGSSRTMLFPEVSVTEFNQPHLVDLFNERVEGLEFEETEYDEGDLGIAVYDSHNGDYTQEDKITDFRNLEGIGKLLDSI